MRLWQTLERSLGGAHRLYPLVKRGRLIQCTTGGLKDRFNDMMFIFTICYVYMQVHPPPGGKRPEKLLGKIDTERPGGTGRDRNL